MHFRFLYRAETKKLLFQVNLSEKRLRFCKFLVSFKTSIFETSKLSKYPNIRIIYLHLRYKKKTRKQKSLFDVGATSVNAFLQSFFEGDDGTSAHIGSSAASPEFQNNNAATKK